MSYQSPNSLKGYIFELRTMRAFDRCASCAQRIPARALGLRRKYYIFAHCEPRKAADCLRKKAPKERILVYHLAKSGFERVRAEGAEPGETSFFQFFVCQSCQGWFHHLCIWWCLAARRLLGEFEHDTCIWRWSCYRMVYNMQRKEELKTKM